MNIILRKADKDDCNLLFQWANDKDVRNSSFNPSEIKYQEHIKWFNKKINSACTCIFIALIGECAVGQVRIDIENHNGIIDYSIDKKYRGMGYGTEILRALEKKVGDNNVHVKRLVAKVKYENEKSQRAFEKNNYQKNIKEGYFFYVKDMKEK